MLTMPFHMPPKTKNMFVMGLESPYLTWNDVRWYLMCLTNRKELMRLSQSLLDYSFEVNLLEEPMDYQVPAKDLITLPHRGHSMHCEAPGEFAEVFELQRQ